MKPPPTHRLPALDLLRGIVIVLMLVDHASFAFNGGRYVTDSVVMYKAGTAIPPAQFLLRWVTHLCAPTFLFLAGVSLAVAVERRRAAGETAGGIDRYLVSRGLFILLLDPLWMSAAFVFGPMLQVLYAIGGGLCAMTVIRRLPVRWVFGLGIFLAAGSEALAGIALKLAGEGTSAGPIGALLLTGGRIPGGWFVLYPLLPWLSCMVLGWWYGRQLVENEGRMPTTKALKAAAAALALFLAVRWVNGYGNMLLYREGGSALQWLHVSKYPPSLSFLSLELGLMFLMLAGLSAVFDRRPPGEYNPVFVFGQTALFFYIVHVHLVTAAARWLDLTRSVSIGGTLIAALAAAAVLYPLCIGFRYLKRRHPKSFLRYI
ncbi:MAG: heparan-alpha-glucosaminide N-acetyltransferase domain-containing protein [Desulfobacterales bacterium]